MLVGIKMLKSASALNLKHFLLKKNSIRRFKKLGEHFYGCKLINSEECDKAYFEYVDILSNQATKELAKPLMEVLTISTFRNLVLVLGVQLSARLLNWFVFCFMARQKLNEDLAKISHQ